MAKTIYLDNTILNKDKKFTFVSSDVVAGATSLGVQSTLGFNSLTTSSGQILMIGELGQEKTEIVRTSPSSAPGGTSITLNSGLRFDHPQDSKVYIIDWDRFEIQWSASTTGTKSTIEAYPEYLQPDQKESLYRDTTQNSGYYFVRFNETITNTNSDWSDPIPFGGYPDNSVYEVKRRALESVNEIRDPSLITDEFLNRALWELRREYHEMPGKRPFRRRFNFIANSPALTGSYRIDVPYDCEKPFSAENIFGVRIGNQANMSYIDKKQWDFFYLRKPHSRLTAAYTVNVSQDLYLENVRDFDDSGSVVVEGTTIGYSARGITGGTLRISSHGSWSASGGSDAWQNMSFGLPDQFTVWGDVAGISGASAWIYFNRPIDTAYVNQNIYLDYYRKVVDFDSDADLLDEPNFDMFVPGLAWKIKKRVNNQLVDQQDSDYQRWVELKQSSWAAEFSGQNVRLIPEIDHLIYPTTWQR